MALTTLAIMPNPAGQQLPSKGDVDATSDAAKATVLDEFNITPGLEYHFEGLQLHWRITNETLVRRTYRWVGLDDGAIEARIALIRENAVAIDFEVLHKRFRYFKNIFDELIGPDRPSVNVSLSLTFGTLFDAGATPLGDGSDYLTISAGMFNFERWFHLRQYFDDLFPILTLSSEDRQMTLTPNQQNIMLLTVESLHALSRLMFRNSMCRSSSVSHEERMFSLQAWEFLTDFERRLAAREFQRPLSDRRSEELAAEIFILCHELGHINLGHLNEVRIWQTNLPRSAAEKTERIRRRQEMEHEADSYAVGGMIRIIAYIRSKSYPQFADAFVDPDSRRDYLLPLIDLFTIMEMGLRGTLDFSSSDCPYPTNLQRIRYLLATNDPSHPLLKHYETQLTFFADWEPRF